MSSTRNNPLVWFERGSNGIVTADRMCTQVIMNVYIVTVNDKWLHAHCTYCVIFVVHVDAGFDVGVAAVQIFAFIVGCVAAGVGK